MSQEIDARAALWGWACPVDPSSDAPRVTLAQGDGGRLTRQLVREHIIDPLGNDVLLQLDDAARLPRPDGPIAVTTDSFVVTPLFFPGGDIGSLAVFGTVNDLAVSGARPCWLTLSLILEEGLPLEILDGVIASVAQAARQCGVAIVAGDTKVVPRGAADGLFINTAGVGVLPSVVPPGPAALRPGDELIVSGPVGEHGLAVMAARESVR
jgi:hydrogenase expression/formation protein HypE